QMTFLFPMRPIFRRSFLPAGGERCLSRCQILHDLLLFHGGINLSEHCSPSLCLGPLKNIASGIAVGEECGPASFTLTFSSSLGFVKLPECADCVGLKPLISRQDQRPAS